MANPARQPTQAELDDPLDPDLPLDIASPQEIANMMSRDPSLSVADFDPPKTQTELVALFRRYSDHEITASELSRRGIPDYSDVLWYLARLGFNNPARDHHLSSPAAFEEHKKNVAELVEMIQENDRSRNRTL